MFPIFFHRFNTVRFFFLEQIRVTREFFGKLLQHSARVIAI